LWQLTAACLRKVNRLDVNHDAHEQKS